MPVDMLRSSDTLRKETRLKPNLKAKQFKRQAMREVYRVGATADECYCSNWEPGDAAIEITFPVGYRIAGGSNQIFAGDWEDCLERIQGLDLELCDLDDFDETDEEYKIIKAATDGGS